MQLALQPGSRLGENEIEDEEQHFQRVIHVFRNYENSMMLMIRRYRRDYQDLNDRHRELLGSMYNVKLDAVEECIKKNQKLLDLIVSKFESPFDSCFAETVDRNMVLKGRNILTEIEVENLRSLLRQMVRDWSEEGDHERALSYQPILQELERRFRGPREDVNILVPGAGLGRLAFEIAKLGFSCQGNEFSLFMLFASDYFLNSAKDCHDIFPWIVPFSNTINMKEQIRAISIPDTIPSNSELRGDFSMIAGDFLEVYQGQSNLFDAITSSFFLDTAKNIVSYLELMHELLKPGGILINIGPLLYHFEGSGKEASLELTLEELLVVAENIGFVLEEKVKFMESVYAQNSLSMHQTIYKVAFFILKRQ